MQRIIVLISLALFALPSQAITEKQEKSKACKAEAVSKELKGAERKSFEKQCMAAHAESGSEKNPEEKKKPKVLTPQQQKMKTCNAMAKGLKGEEFKKVRNDCLRAK
ncbi:MAG: PsiF family protein [Burkholderiales bacterium]